MIRQLVALLLLAGVAGCAGEPPPQTFPPLNYSYLPPITLNVATVTVANSYAPDPNAAQLIGQDPAPPPSVLSAELSRRLIASGTPGIATVTIETASIDQSGGNLVGTMTVRVDVASADGNTSGFTEATVSHSQTAPDSDASQNDTQAALYQMTKQLMDAMNVQLQYQIQHNLGSWIVGNASPALPGGGGLSGPAAGAIVAAPLAPPTAIPGAASPANPTAIPPAPPLSGPSLLAPAPTAIPPAPPAYVAPPNYLSPPAYVTPPPPAYLPQASPAGDMPPPQQLLPY